LNRDQEKNNPAEWKGARLDRFTFAHALRYLKKSKPRFLYISLNDSDEWAHLNDYEKYLGSLKYYDRMLEKLIRVIDSMKGETTLIVTTDHGRGRGDDFRKHGLTRAAAPIWLYARGPRVRTGANIERVENRSFFSHLDIRPTIEALFGIRPRECAFCGLPLRAVAFPSEP